jgi:aminopeptidase N
MQIDLVPPLAIDSVMQNGRPLRWRDDSAAHFVLGATAVPGQEAMVRVYFSGRPRVAPRPPWDAGFSWSTDSQGPPWIETTEQGEGASIWWANKDTQADEPDSLRLTVHVPEAAGIDIGPGRPAEVESTTAGWTTRRWFEHNPINNYAVAINTGHYTHWHEEYAGEAGILDLNFYPIDYHEAAARRQWAQVRPMLACFEHWFGPYPWYNDGYKLIEVTYPGMEHQTAVTYGNGFANGYGGRDQSGTGLGMEWDFIIVHESAHEWWGNSITTPDLADMWVHESFANYAENLYVECQSGKEAGARYLIGSRRGIRNRQPVIPAAYGVNAQGSGDMYPKGGNMLHTIRQIVANDEQWRGILRGLQSTFRHRVTTGQEVQDYISTHAGIDLSKVFDQYLTQTDIPVLEYQRSGDTLRYRWNKVVPGFDMPIDVATGADTRTRLHPTTVWQDLALGAGETFVPDENYYVVVREVTP